MGRIAGPYGVHGAVRVVPWSDDPATLLQHAVWALRDPRVDGAWRDTQVVRARMHVAAIVAELDGVTSRETAAALRGQEVGLPKETLPPPGKDEYYWSDLEGLEVVNRQGVMMGRVAGVAGNGAHPILRVAGDGEAKERLIPFVAAYVDRVDVPGGRIEVDWELDY